MSNIPAWSVDTIAFDVQGKWRLMVTVSFAGSDKMRAAARQLFPTPITTQATWISCPKPPAGSLTSGTMHEILEIDTVRQFDVKPFHADGADCGPPGLATLPFVTGTVVQEEHYAELLYSNTHRFTTVDGSTIHVIIVIRNEGGGGNPHRTCADQTKYIATKLGLKVSAPRLVKSGRGEPVG